MRTPHSSASTLSASALRGDFHGAIFKRYPLAKRASVRTRSLPQPKFSAIRGQAFLSDGSRHKQLYSAAVEVEMPTATYPTVEEFVGKTPLVRLQRLPGNTTNVVLAKLEGNNPAGSVKDRPALSMITEAEKRGLIRPGDTLIEATSGNTGIALAMAAAIKGYRMKLIMPANMSEERRAAMAAYGAELITVPPGQMELARDLAKQMEAAGTGVVLDQFGNLDNPQAHFCSTGPEIWHATAGRVTHFVSSMGTTGTIMGTGRYLKQCNPAVQIVGLQPGPNAQIAGIRRWPKEYLPKIYQHDQVDRVMDISQREAEEMARALARVEGIFCGVSSGGAVSAALRLSAEVEHSTIVVIICDRGDRYLSTGLFSEAAFASDPAACPVREYPAAVARLSCAYAAPHYILFMAQPHEHCGAHCCANSARAVPLIRTHVTAAGGTLLEVHVDEEEWKDLQHPLRREHTLRLTDLPTLVRWTKDGPGARVGLELQSNGASDEEMEAAILRFIRQTSIL